MYGITCIPPSYFSSPQLRVPPVILEILQPAPPLLIKPNVKSSNPQLASYYWGGSHYASKILLPASWYKNQFHYWHNILPYFVHCFHCISSVLIIVRIIIKSISVVAFFSYLYSYHQWCISFHPFYFHPQYIITIIRIIIIISKFYIFMQPSFHIFWFSSV